MSAVKQAVVHPPDRAFAALRNLPKAIWRERQMLRRLGFDERVIEDGIKAALLNNTTIEKELLSGGVIAPDDYYRRLARYLVLPFQSRLEPDCVIDRPGIDRLLADPRGLRLDSGETERRFAVVPYAGDLADLHIRLSSRPEIRRCVIITTPEAVRAAVWQAGERRRMWRSARSPA